nr:hypothetical protein [Tanacetum cinerariifolium]
YCCSNGSLIDKIICDLIKAPDLPRLHTFSSNQRHCFNCKDVLGDGELCQRCTCMSISENSSQSPPHINHHCCYECGDPLDGIFCKRCTCKSCGKGAHTGYNCPPKVSVISNPEPCKSQTIDELLQTLPSFHPTCYSGDESPFTCNSTPNIVDDSPNVFNPPPQPPQYSYEFCENDAYYGYDFPPQVSFTYDPKPSWSENIQRKKEEEEKQIAEEQAAKARYWKIPICYDDDEDYTIAITPKEPEDSLTCDDFTTFSNLLFDDDYDFSSSDDESFSDEDISKKIYSNPLFDEKIISIKIDPHHINAESDLIESLLTQDSSIISSSSKINYLLDEFAGKLILLKTIPLGIDETDYDPKEEIRLVETLLYDNSSPLPPEEFIFENFDAIIESFSPSRIPVEDSDPLMEDRFLSCF